MKQCIGLEADAGMESPHLGMGIVVPVASGLFQ